MNMENIQKTIADKIRTTRRKKGITQADVARKSALSVNFYARVERGETKPSAETIVKIKRALGAEYSEILP